MKKAVGIVLVLFMLLSSSVIVEAMNIYDNENITIVFADDSNFTSREKEIICSKLQSISSGEEDSPKNIICSMVGHSYTEENLHIITHKARPTSPRCKDEEYQVKKCSRCDFTETEFICSTYIICCE